MSKHITNLEIDVEVLPFDPYLRYANLIIDPIRAPNPSKTAPALRMFPFSTSLNEGADP